MIAGSQYSEGSGSVPLGDPIPLGEPIALGGERLDPGAWPFRWLNLPPAPPSPSRLAARLIERLRTPTAGPPLSPRPPIVVLMPDSTRSNFVRPMIEATAELLDDAGLASGDVRLLVAAGLHRPPRPEELDSLMGSAAGRLPVDVHDADDPLLVHCATTRRRTPVLLPKLLLEARTLVVIGGITPHYFAGWTGGLKGVVPGAAGRLTITANHRLAVDADAPDGLHRACREGNMRGNPVAADLIEAAAKAPAPFLVNAVIGRDGEPRAVVTGNARAAHRAGIRMARRAIRVELSAVDLAVVAAGDPGRERDWIQAHKVVRQGAALVADGGTLVALASCPDGLGSSTLLDWFGVEASHLAREVASRYTLHGHTALAIRALTHRIRIILVSRLEPAMVKAMGMIPAVSLAEALDQAARGVVRGAPALALPRAGTLLPARA